MWRGLGGVGIGGGGGGCQEDEVVRRKMEEEVWPRFPKFSQIFDILAQFSAILDKHFG